MAASKAGMDVKTARPLPLDDRAISMGSWQNIDMPEDWIGKLAEEAKTHDEQQLKREQHRLHEGQVTAEKSQRLWDALLATVERDVRRFQQEFAHDPKRSLALERIPPSGFRVCRPEFPSVSLDVRLQPSGVGIEFKYDTTTGHEHATSEWSGTLVIRVDPNDNLYLSQYGRDFLSLDEVSKMFLERVLTGVAF